MKSPLVTGICALLLTLNGQAAQKWVITDNDAQSLHDAIVQSEQSFGADVIELDLPAGQELVITAPLPEIGDQLQIVSKGTPMVKMRIAAGARAFTIIAGGDLTLDGIHLQGGANLPDYDESALYIDQGTLVLRNSHLVDHFAQNGAAIWASHARLTIENTTFAGNRAAQKGAAIWIADSEVQLHNAVFDNNQSLVNGGAIMARASTISVQGGRFADNESSSGGAITAMGSTLTLTDGTIFSRNSAKYYGAAIQSEGVNGQLTIRQGDFSNHKAQDGAAVYVKQQEVAVTQSDFSNNQASRYGGAITVWEGTLKFAGTDFSHNTAMHNGGAIYLTGRLASLQDNRLDSNQARRGGAIFVRSSLNIDSQATLRGADFRDNKADFGGAVYTEGAILHVQESSFVYNSAKRHGGAILFSAGQTPRRLHIQNTTIGFNQATVGAGVHASSLNNRSIFELVSSTVVHNQAAKTGGGFYQIQGRSRVANSALLFNTAGDPDTAATADIFGLWESLGGNAISVMPKSWAGHESDRAGSLDLPLDVKLEALSASAPWVFAFPEASLLHDGGNTESALDMQGRKLSTDQRGQARVVGKAVDIGAVEFQRPISR